MSVMLTWLADALRDEGLTVAEQSGWKTYGRPGDFNPEGPGWHHTGTTTSESNTHPTLRTCIEGRSDLAGPLCQVMIGYDGVCYVIAAGRANHGGACNGWGPYTSSRDANDQIVGFEIDYDGTQPMSAAQKDAATRASAAVLKRLGHDHTWATRHEEWSTTGKWDTGGVTGDEIRSLVRDYLAGGPPAEDDGAPVKKHSKSNADDQSIAANEWKRLRLTSKESDSTGLYAVCPGPAEWFSLSVHVTAKADEGVQVSVRAYRDKDDGETRVSTYSTRKRTVPAGGYLAMGYGVQGTIGEGEWLRFELHANGKATVDSVTTQCAVW